MKILDALACGLPVITPLFGGPADFCTPATAIRGFGADPDRRLPRPALDAAHQPADVGRARRETSPGSSASPARTGRRSRPRRAGHTPGGRRGFSWDAAAAGSSRRGPRRRRAASPGGRGGPVAGADAAPAPRPTGWAAGSAVIVPTYNRRDMLLKCLRALETGRASCPRNSRSSWWTTDPPTAPGRDARRPFPSRCIITVRPNQGPGPARNFGLDQARRRAGAVTSATTSSPRSVPRSTTSWPMPGSPGDRAAPCWATRLAGRHPAGRGHGVRLRRVSHQFAYTTSRS